MHPETNIDVLDDNKINELKSSISNLKDHLYIRNLKKDLKVFVHQNLEIDASQDYLKTEIITNAPSWFPKAKLSRTQTDLIANSENGEEYILFDYFINHESPSIQTENGLFFNGSLIETLAGPLAPGQYAQASGDGALSIGEVSSLSGTAKAIRLDGNEFVLSDGDPVFQGDTIEVSDSGAVGLTFVDKTTLSLSEGGKMVLDELVYDPETGNGSLGVDMVEGAFSFISGEIAKTGPDAMTIKTPVATVGIRGTTVAGKAAVEGNENSFTLLQDADGGVGEISVSNAGGTQVLGQVGATTSIASFNAPPPPPIILSAAQIQANYGTALNILPATPTVAPTPQEAPPPQEQQQEEAQEEASEESDEETEEASEEVSGEEEGSEEGEEELAEEEGPTEELAEEEGPTEEELAEAEEGLPEEDIAAASQDGALVEEGLPAGEEVAAVEEGAPPPEESPPEGDEQAAREAFETALAAGASPEQAMAEAAAAGGFDEPGARGPAPDSGPLGGEPGGPPLGGDPLGGPIPSAPVTDPLGGPIPGAPATDPLGGAPFAQTFAPGVGGPILGSPLGPGPMNAGQGLVMGPVFGMGPSFGSAVMDTMGAGPMGIGDPFLQGVSGFGGEPILGMLGPEPYGSPETEAPTEAYFFEDPALYDDFNNQIPEPEPEHSTETSSSNSTTINGTSSNDTIDKSSETNSFIINGLDGNDTLKGGVNNDTINGGNGLDTIFGMGGDDTLRGGHGNDSIHGDAGNDKLIGEQGDDTLKGGDGDDIIVGGIGDDILYGNNGIDRFYYQSGDIDGSSKDIIADFRAHGNDLMVSSLAPASAYNRKQIHTDATQVGSNYDITNNSNELPYVFNFTYNVAASTADNTTALANHLTGFSISVSGTESLATNETMFIAVGDGIDTYIYGWTDTNNHHGMIAESELDPIVKLTNFDNDKFDGSEFSFQTITGV